MTNKTKTLTQWAETLNIPIATLYRYLKVEQSLEGVIAKLERRK